MTIELKLNTTKDKLIGYLETAARLSRQNAGRSTMPEIEQIHLGVASEITQLITEIKHGQLDLAATTSKSTK